MLLKNGSTGNYVMYLQYGLHIMCCPPGSFDSKFGSGTENAVKKYQGKKGLTQDGIVGDGTWNALVSDIKTIQQLLKNKGYYASTVDGLAGSGTYNAVISFQKASGLTADGYGRQCHPKRIERFFGRYKWSISFNHSAY